MSGANVEAWVRLLPPEHAANFALGQVRQQVSGSREVPIATLGQSL